MKKIHISDHFTPQRLILFSLPAIGMQLVDNIYQVADGYFISNYIGASEFAAENLIFPPLLLASSIGLMFGSGAGAMISYEQGKGNQEGANRLFSMLMSVLVIVSIVISSILFLLMQPISNLVGASEEMLPHCVEYGRILAAFMPFMMVNMAFHPLLITAEHSGLGVVVAVANAAVNIVLDALFVACFHWNLTGAAVATGLAWVISALIPTVYFFRAKDGMRFSRPCRPDKKLWKALYNGASEMLDAIAYAVVAIVFNMQLMKWAQEAGIDAYAVTEYVSGIFSAVFFGISMSITPIVGYHLGNNNSREIDLLWKNGLLLMLGIGILNGAVCFGLASPIAGIFVGYDTDVMQMAMEALRISAFCFLLYGMTTFGSAFYTGLNDGTASLVIAGIKSFILPILLVLVLPQLFGIKGIWLVNPIAELITIIVLLIMSKNIQSHLFKGDRI